MAQQLLQDRTPSAYAGVEAYARRHPKEDAGALAWLAIGYARTLDHDYAKAIDPFNRAKAGPSELGDYVAYYLGDAYFQTGHNAEALSTLANFSKSFPDSILIRDAHLVYANALLVEGRAPEAAALLEKDRSPVRSDLEFAIGRAYEAAGDNEKAAQSLPQPLLQPCQHRRSRSGGSGIAKAGSFRIRRRAPHSRRSFVQGQTL